MRHLTSALSSGAGPQMISPERLQGAAIRKVMSSYPASAKQTKVQGNVEVRVTVDEAGIVTEAVAISGPSELRNVSEKAASQWQFKPMMVNGRPEKVSGVLTFSFRL